jgi:WD40 repeat protein
MAFLASDPNLILVSNNEKRIGLWNALTGQLISDISLEADPPYDSFTRIAISPDGKFAAFGGRYGKRAYLWDLKKSEMTWRSSSFSGELDQLLFVAETELLISTGFFSNEVASLLLSDGSVTARNTHHPYTVLACAGYKGQALTAVYSRERGHIKFIDLVKGRTVSVAPTDSNGGADLCKGVFSKDVALFATLPDEGPSDVWNVETGKRVVRFDAGFSYFEKAQFTDDNRGLVAVTAGGGHELDSCALWNCASARIEMTFDVSEEPFTVVVCGDTFVAGGRGGTVEMFQIG